MRILLLLTLFIFAAAVGAQTPTLIPSVYLSPQYSAAVDSPSSIIIPGPDEPGKRLVVTGQVLDGTTPIAGASIYVFHTDLTGEYAPGISGPDAELNPRLYGALRTDSEGSYKYETIIPGSYDNNPAHVHYIVIATGYLPRIFDLWFQDDPLLVSRREAGEPQISQSMRNSPFYKAAPDMIGIRPVKRDSSGVSYVVRDLDMIPE